MLKNVTGNLVGKFKNVILSDEKGQKTVPDCVKINDDFNPSKNKKYNLFLLNF